MVEIPLGEITATGGPECARQHATWLPLQPRRFRTQLQAAITHYTSYSPSSTLAANISGEILIGAAYVTPAPEPAAAAISPAPSGALTPLTPILSALSGLTGGTVAGSLLSAASSVSASGATMRTKEDHWELRIEGLELRNLLLDRSASLLDAARLKLQPSASIYTDVHVGDKSVRTHEVRVRRRRDAKAVVRYPGAIVFEVGGLRRSVAPRRVGFVLRIRGPFQSRLTDTTLGEAYAEIASIPKVYPEDENDKDDKSKSVERQWFKFSPDCGEVGARLTLHAIDPPNPLTTSSTISSALDHKEGDDARANFISRVLRGPDAAGVLAPDESKPVVAALDLQVVAAKVDEGEGGGGEPDTYCVVQYEHRWEKTAVIVNSREAVFDDCFRFEVREPSSLLTVTLWDDCSGRRVRGRGREDAFLGMVRMRLSTLDANRRYDRKFQLLVPDTSGGNNNNNNNSSSNSNNNSIPVRRVGWLRLVFCLAVPSRAALLRAYIRPAMPAEAYIEDATDAERARRHKILTKELVKALKENEPALQIRPEVVKRVRDNHYDFDLRIAKINYNRTRETLEPLAPVKKWLAIVRSWDRPYLSSSVVGTYVFICARPGLLLPLLCLSISLTLARTWFHRADGPVLALEGYKDVSEKDDDGDEKKDDNDGGDGDDDDSSSSSDEEDSVSSPTRGLNPYAYLQHHYKNTMRVLASVQDYLGTHANNYERVTYLFKWADPRVSCVAMVSCFILSFLLYFFPKPLMAVAGMIALRPPRFRSPTPPPPVSMFLRLPSKQDHII